MAAKKAPEGETKGQKFIRLGNIRIGNAMSAIELLGDMAGGEYDYTDDQVNKLDAAIRGKLDDAVKSLKARKRATAAASGVL